MKSSIGWRENRRTQRRRAQVPPNIHGSIPPEQPDLSFASQEHSSPVFAKHWTLLTRSRLAYNNTPGA